MSQNTASLVFPNQLFMPNPALSSNPKRVALIEEDLCFGSVKYINNFHKQKLWFHRSTMKNYQNELKKFKFEVEYISHEFDGSTLKKYLLSMFMTIYWKKN